MMTSHSKKYDTNEKWLPIPNYEGIYEASNYGRIRTAEGKTTYDTRHGFRIWKQRVLRLKITTNKYGRKDARVNLWKDGVVKTYLVARLVAMTWCSGFSSSLTVNHKDGNSLNNNSDNLEWITLSKNILHAFDNELVKSQQKLSLISDKDKYSFKSMSEASRFLDKSTGYISDCIKKNRCARDCYGNKYQIVLQKNTRGNTP